MNLYLSFLNGSKVLYSTGVNDLLNFETVGMLFAAFGVAVPTLVLRWIFLESTKPRTRLLLSGCMVLVHIATVLWLAWLLCSLTPNEPAQIWNAWVTAFLGGTAWTLVMIAITWFCRPKRQLSETDKMKLKDI